MMTRIKGTAHVLLVLFVSAEASSFALVVRLSRSLLPLFRVLRLIVIQMAEPRFRECCALVIVTAVCECALPADPGYEVRKLLLIRLAVGNSESCADFALLSKI
jgi:hypothetical protein